MVWNSLWGFVVGACTGSFLYLCIQRIPNNESILFPRSHCEQCHTRLWNRDLIPIVSYLWLQGRCRTCQSMIPIGSFIVELLTALIGIWTFTEFGISLLGFTYFIFLASLIVASFIDLGHRILPDSITLGGMAAGFVLSFWVLPISPLESLLGVILGGGLLLGLAVAYQKITKREGLGGGDVKLAGMLGAWLGTQNIFLVLLVSSVSGALLGLTYILLKRKDLQFAVPFGPFLSWGTVVTLFYGEPLRQFLGQ